MKLFFLIPALMLLVSCGSDNSNFYADCKGKIITYSQGVETVANEARRYEFADNRLIGRECSLTKGIIFCYKEMIGPESTSKEQLIFDRGNYTLTDIKTTIEANKGGGAKFTKTEIYQSNCPMTIKPAK